MTSLRAEELAKVMSDVRLSLMRLTGVDRGVSPEEWQRWRRDAPRDFEVAEVAPRLPDMEQNMWNAFWGLERVGEGDRRRERRGQDPERRGGDGGK